MLEREIQFRKSFYFLKRSAKSPTLPSYTYGYTAGLGDKEPAGHIYNYILELEGFKSSFEFKIDCLENFLHAKNKEEAEKQMMRTGFYNMILSLITQARKNIKEGVPVQTRRA